MEMIKQSEKEIKPVYFIYGNEPLLLEEALKRLKDRLEKESPGGIDVNTFYASSSSQEIINAANTLPLMARKRLVIVKEAEKLPPQSVTALIEYADKPSKEACLVLVAGGIKKKENRLFKHLDKKRSAFEYKIPSKGKYPLWIQKEFIQRGKDVDWESANCLLQEVGYDLFRLRNEIEKVCLFHLSEKKIGKEEILEIISRSRESSVYEFLDALGERRSSALFLWRKLIKEGEDETGIFYQAQRHFRKLLMAKALWEEGVRGAEFTKALKALPFLVEKYRRQIGNFSLQELKEIYYLFAEGDLAVKRGEQEHGLSLEMLVTKVLGK